MDPNALKVILESQAQTFRRSVDVIVSQFESRIVTLEASVREFTQAQVHDHNGELKLLRKSENEYKTKIEELKQRIQEQETRLNYQEDYCRRNNFRISVQVKSGNRPPH